MKHSILLVAVTAVVFGASPAQTQQAAQPRTFLVVVDDLHLDFRSTPQLRQLTGRVMSSLMSPDATGALVTTGDPEAFIAPTSVSATLESAVPRLVGKGLTTSEILLSRPELQNESGRRAATAVSAAADAIARVAATQKGRPFNVIYLSGGDAAGPIPERVGLVESALRAGAPIHTIDMRGLTPPSSQSAGQPEWSAYVAAARSSLSDLASQTRGTAAFTAGDVDALVTRLVGTGQ
jgi:hypothetical protein